MEWLKPYTDDAIRELGRKGTKSMLAVPISFVSEHIETLEEIDGEYRELAEKSGEPFFANMTKYDPGSTARRAEYSAVARGSWG